jgi:hypothetical protein
MASDKDLTGGAGAGSPPPAAPAALREEEIANAVAFLSHPRVRLVRDHAPRTALV